MMAAGLVLSFVVATAAGVLLLRALWPHGLAPCPWPLAVALGVGIGAGVSSAALFLWMLAFGPSAVYPVVETAVVTLAAAAVLAGRGKRRPALAEAASAPSGPQSRSLLTIGFVLVLVAAAAAFVSMLRQHPHGEWDAWMNWDMRARMFFRGGDGWRAAFSGAFPWSHPDYPVLVPTLVARSWLYAGKETVLGPHLVAATFTFGTVALLGSALAVLRGRSQGLLAAMILLATPFFVVHGTSLYADVPLAFFLLAAFVALGLDARYGDATARFAALAGLATGLAMWTKNEGWLFGAALVAALILAGRREGWAVLRPRLVAFAAGALAPVLLVLVFKLAFAPPNDLLSTLGLDRTVGRLTDPGRYALTAREYVLHLLSFGSNRLGAAVWPLAACFAGLGLARARPGRSWLRTGAVTLLLLLAGHFLVFVSMADELARLLASSLDRLLLQIWPAALFLCFMALRTPDEGAAS